MDPDRQSAQATKKGLIFRGLQGLQSRINAQALLGRSQTGTQQPESGPFQAKAAASGAALSTEAIP